MCIVYNMYICTLMHMFSGPPLPPLVTTARIFRPKPAPARHSAPTIPRRCGRREGRQKRWSLSWSSGGSRCIIWSSHGRSWMNKPQIRMEKNIGGACRIKLWLLGVTTPWGKKIMVEKNPGLTLYGKTMTTSRSLKEPCLAPMAWTIPHPWWWPWLYCPAFSTIWGVSALTYHVGFYLKQSKMIRTFFFSVKLRLEWPNFLKCLGFHPT